MASPQMKKTFFFFTAVGLLISSINTVAQTFPPCQGTDSSAWSRCTAPTLVFDNGNTYAGEWLNGKPNGQGIYTFKNTGDTYKGQFVDSKFNGSGVFTWSNGTQYVGQFSNSYITGQGTKTWNTKQKYVGQFVNGYMEGTGTFTWPNGAKYVGQWQKSLGVNGTLTYPNGATAVGTVDKNGAFVATVQQAQAPQQRQAPTATQLEEDNKVGQCRGVIGAKLQEMPDQVSDTQIAFMKKHESRFNRIDAVVNDCASKEPNTLGACLERTLSPQDFALVKGANETFGQLSRYQSGSYQGQSKAQWADTLSLAYCLTFLMPSIK